MPMRCRLNSEAFGFATSFSSLALTHPPAIRRSVAFPRLSLRAVGARRDLTPPSSGPGKDGPHSGMPVALGKREFWKWIGEARMPQTASLERFLPTLRGADQGNKEF